MYDLSQLIVLGVPFLFPVLRRTAPGTKRPKMDTYILSIHPQTTQQDSMHCWYTNASPGLEKEKQLGNLSPAADAGKIHTCYTCMIRFPIYMRFSGRTFASYEGSTMGTSFPG